jgi:hypothetical protein
MTQYNTNNPTGDGKEGSNKSHMADTFHTRTLTGGTSGNECSDSDIGSDTPASIGQIHDVFAEFEETLRHGY